ncbi:MAG: hypothetical protein AAGF26_12605 [Cyanobacteria bacterium P01_G01_bin.49]
MSNSIGYYTSYTPGDEGLLEEMQSAWGSSFQDLKNNERLWMIASLSLELWQKTDFEDESIREGCEKAVSRAISELKSSDVMGLIEALVNQIRY